MANRLENKVEQVVENLNKKDLRKALKGSVANRNVTQVDSEDDLFDFIREKGYKGGPVKLPNAIKGTTGIMDTRDGQMSFITAEFLGEERLVIVKRFDRDTREAVMVAPGQEVDTQVLSVSMWINNQTEEPEFRFTGWANTAKPLEAFPVL